MIFPDYGEIRAFGVLVGLLLAAIWAFRAASSMRKIIRVSVRLLSGFIIVLASTVTLILAGCGTVTRSAPIYSPDHQKAIRITDLDWGAVGGDTSVELYSHHGLISEKVFTGEFAAVGPKDISWVNDSEVSIRYSGFATKTAETCNQAHSVKVKCVLVPLAFRM